MPADVELLIVGAGPFGLALAAYASHLGLDYLIAGEPMGFWQHHMPAGMYLRSGYDWHYDPLDEATIARYFREQGLDPDEVVPIPLETYLPYGAWFQEQKGIAPLPRLVERLDRGAGDAGFRARFVDGEEVSARHVALALGFEHFAQVPPELAALLPPGRSSHTCHTVDLERFEGQRVLLVGGRQSAFEWAALLLERGAAEVHLSHRHPTPAYTESDWSWTDALVDRMVREPGWYRRLPPQEQHAIDQRMWGEGRLKLEPWLEPRLASDAVHLWPSTRITGACEQRDGALAVTLDSGAELAVDHVILATGYKVDLTRIPLLARGDLLPRMATRDGFPALDAHFQTTAPGLFITSMAATHDFGPCFGFTRAVRQSAILIGQGITGG
ncbi:MAG TPA: FAD-dependent oxidoreductase [Thermomicrobiaceae bacterium]|nr:FAD-dependent oxidoreductase [Thermomicrobiaceae bacterium]